MKNFDSKFIEIAEIFASMSNCVSYKVGCIFVKKGRVISSGYNGTPSGYKYNCDQVFPNYNPLTDREKHREFSAAYEIHAELNCLNWAAKQGGGAEGCDVYCTTEPCKDCTKSLIQLGINRVIFLNRYDGNDSIREQLIKFYKDSGVSFGQFNKSLNKVNWF